jgi:transposase
MRAMRAWGALPRPGAARAHPKQIKAIAEARREQLKAKPAHGTNPLVLMPAQILGIGIETADLLVHEVLDTKPAPSGRTLRRPDRVSRRERQGGSRAGPGQARQLARPPQLAWRWLQWQKGSALAHREPTRL